jgi:hypothetical protein
MVQRRQPINSLGGAVAVTGSAHDVVAPTSPLNESESRYFETLAQARASFDWSHADRMMLTRASKWFVTADLLWENWAHEKADTKWRKQLFKEATTLETMARALLSRLGVVNAMGGTAALTAKRRGETVRGVASRMELDESSDGGDLLQ